ncbi:MAG: sigma-54 dependent transcriptional regulator [Planctomycetes bacterium]|nr:sigma-54 dependent transcriptional regulator [Planctomycetota bacterium]
MKVLVVDDEPNIRSTLTVCLENLGCAVRTAESAVAAERAFASERFDLVLLDVRLGDANGLDLIPAWLAQRPTATIVVMTAFASIDAAVEAVRRGAFDYVPKPFTPEQIRQTVARAAERDALRHRVGELEQQVSAAAGLPVEESKSPAMRSALEVLRRAAASDAPVLLRGEHGTGKTELARALHARSPRAKRPFVVVNCPTLTGELLAAELFGHTRGAFTGAVRDQPGRVETADGGTLFLDEVAEIAPALQAKLLRFAQDHEYERVGENTTRRADVRIVAATNRDIEADVAAGRFREDLLFRLNVVEVLVPPLRDRSEDIEPLAANFLALFSTAAKRAPMRFTPEAALALRAYRWPGNVRELRNAVERATILCSGPNIGVESLPERMRDAAPERPRVGGDFTIDEIERAHISAVVARVPKAEDQARVLGIDPSTLWRKRKRYESGEA